MNLAEAIIESAEGRIIVSNEGRRYLPDELQAKKLGVHSAVFNDGYITEVERKGRWKTIDAEMYSR